MNVDTRDDALGGVLDDAVRHLEPGTDRLPQIRTRGSRRRFAILATASVGVTVFVGTVVGTAALIRSDRPDTSGAGEIAPSTRPADVESQPAVITYRNDEHGFTVTYPQYWVRAEENLMPMLSDPHQILGLGTYRLRPGGDACAHVPVNSLVDLGPTDAFIDLEEEEGRVDAAIPERPVHFGPGLGGPSEAVDCVLHQGGTVDFEEHWFYFQDQGRMFYVRVAFGNEASAETRQQAWDILDSLEFEPAER